MKTNPEANRQPRKLRHSTYRKLKGRDRRASLRLDREAVTFLLHPALFERQLGVSA